MYESFYNLKVEPFRLSPDHRFCFSHKSYAKAKAYMQYAIHRAEGFVMVTGKPGTGKTTLVNDLVDGLSHSRIVVATIVSTQLEADDLLRLVACNFGLEVDAPNKAVLLQGLSVRLRRYHEEGTRALLIIDEAQDLSASALEELRLLTNLQLNNQPLLQIFLVGQENLRELVQKPSMEQVHQRLVAACHLEALSEADTEAYIKHRLDRVGWKNDPKIDEGVYPVVFQFSQGVPRRINLVCSRFLLHGCVEEKHRIRAADVRTVVNELQHEQLAPVGFKADLPPLLDEADEPPEAELTPPVEADAGQSTAPEMEQPVTDALESKQTGREEPGVAVAAPPSPDNPVASETADLCSLEEQVKREESHPALDTEGSGEDVIQENYFSLSGSVDLPSEPVPIRKPVEKSPAAHSYGDRFANARLNEAAGGTKTHYYNEYQAGGAHPRGGGRRWSMLSIALLFLFVAITVSVALFLFSPRLFQDGVATLEQQFDQLISSPGKAQVAGEEPGNIARNTETVQQASAHEAPQSGTAPVAAGTTRDRSLPVSDEEPGQLPDSHSVVAEKKTAPEVELSPVSPLSEKGGSSPMETATVPSSQAARGDGLLHWWRSEHGQSVRPSAQAPAADRSLPSNSGTQNLPADESIALASQPYPVLRNGKQKTEVNVNGAVVTSLPATPGAPGTALPAPVESPSTDALVGKLHGSSGSGTDIAALPGAQSRPDDAPLDTRKADVEAPLKSGEKSGAGLQKKILFSSDSTVIGDEYKVQLSEVVEWLRRHAGRSVRIIGYADSLGDARYNQALSLKRAEVVAAYLENENIPSSRLQVEGRGIYPGTENSSGNGGSTRQMQRFVEIVSGPLVD